MIYLDLETTGLNPDTEEILQIGLLSEDGKVLMNEYLKPKSKKSWNAAERIHGISPKKVDYCKSLEYVTPDILQILEGQEVVIYNAGFDVGFLTNEMKWVIGNVRCAMLEFAELFGEWDDYRKSYRWKKLNFAASHVGHIWGQDNEHDAISDCRATKSVWEYIKKEKEKQKNKEERV